MLRQWPSRQWARPRLAERSLCHGWNGHRRRACDQRQEPYRRHASGSGTFTAEAAAQRRMPSVCQFHDNCAEGLVSGPALRQRLGEGRKLSDDPLVQELVVQYLGQLAASLVLVWSPHRIVWGRSHFGGGFVVADRRSDAYCPQRLWRRSGCHEIGLLPAGCLERRRLGRGAHDGSSASSGF